MIFIHRTVYNNEDTIIHPMILSPTKYSYKNSCFIDNEFEISIHKCNKHFVNEIHHIFQSTDLENLLAIPVMQRSKYDLVNFGEEVDKHRDILLENVIQYDVMKD